MSTSSPTSDACRAYLNPDQFFPGWVFVVLRRHARELYELSRAERARVIEDVSRVARALAQVYQPVKMNYELLGNQVAHIHWHLVPRLAGDPEPQLAGVARGARAEDALRRTRSPRASRRSAGPSARPGSPRGRRRFSCPPRDATPA